MAKENNEGVDKNNADGHSNQLSLIQNVSEYAGIFDTKNSTDDCTSDLTEMQSDLEDNCIYIFDNRRVNVTSWKHRDSMFVSVENSRISTSTFESFAAGIYAMLPRDLEISAEEINYAHGIKVGQKTAQAFARYQFSEDYFRTVSAAHIRASFQTCISLLKERHIWNATRMLENPELQARPGLLERAQEVRSQIGASELSSACTLTGKDLVEAIKIGTRLCPQKPPEIELRKVVQKGEAKGYNLETRELHYVHGSHRKCVDISFDEQMFKDNVIKFSSSERISVEATWTEQMEDGVVKRRTLVSLTLVQDTLFEVKK